MDLKLCTTAAGYKLHYLHPATGNTCCGREVTVMVPEGHVGHMGICEACLKTVAAKRSKEESGE